MQKNTINIGRFTGPGLVISIMLGLFVPGLSLLKPLMPYLLMLMLFLSFIRIRFHIRSFVRKELLYFPSIVLLVLPFILVPLSATMPTEYRLGFLLVAITPQALGAPVIVDAAHGDRELITANVILYNLIAPFIFALLPNYHLGAEVRVDVIGIMLNVAKIVFIPLALALIVRRIEKVKQKITKSANVFNTLALFMIVAAAIASSTGQLKNTPMPEVLKLFAFTMLLSSCLFGVGYIISLKNGSLKRTLPVVLGHKNTVLTILVALSNFEPPVAVPAVLYLISHHILNSIHVTLFARRSKKEQRYQ